MGFIQIVKIHLSVHVVHVIIWKHCFKAGLTLGDFFLRQGLFQGRAIFDGRTIMAPCVHIRRLDFRKSPTIFPKNSVHHNNIRSI